MENLNWAEVSLIMESDQIIIEPGQDIIKGIGKGFDTESFKTVTEKRKLCQLNIPPN